MDTTSQKKKLTWLLLLQGWTMLWVIIGHAPLADPPANSAINVLCHKIAGGLFEFAYSFHMPLFIMISGYLFNMTRIEKKWKYGKMIKEKWVRLGIPYLFFITLAILSKLIAPDSVNRQVASDGLGILSNYIDPFNGALQEMWFVAVIFWYFLLYPIYPFLLRNHLNILLTLLSAIIMFFLPIEMLTSVFAIDRAIHFFFFFFLGTCISKLKLEAKIASWQAILLTSVGFLLSFSTGIKLVTPLLGSIAFWGLAIKIDRIFTDNLFSSFRNYTYQIFLIGIFVQLAVKIVSAKIQFPGSYPIWWMICVFAGIFVPVGIACLAKRTNNSFVLKILGL